MWLSRTTAQTGQGRASEFFPNESAVKTDPDIMSHTKSPVQAGSFPHSYLTLVKRHPLTSIRNEDDLDAAQAVIDGLLREELDDGKQAYLDALSDLVIVYEQGHHAVAPREIHEVRRK
jgi:hypothetical protein